MANFSGKYFKVWEVEDKGSMRKVNLGDSAKDKDGNYENWTWFGCLLVGKAKDVALKKDDVVEIKSGMIKYR